MRIVSPSLLAADFGNLERDINMIDDSAAGWIHVDIMDGCFVPNISFGFAVLETIKKNSSKIMDVHLMIASPERYLSRVIEGGADIVTFHLEATDNCRQCIDVIRSSGAQVGVSICPTTPINLLDDYIEYVDLILVMSVEPGFGAQGFIEESIERISNIRAMIDNLNWAGRSKPLIEVDGGVSTANARRLYAAGADVLVAGSAIFKAESPSQMISEILEI